MLETLSPLASLALLIALATVLNRVIEYALGTPFDKFEKLKPFRWLLMYASLALGVAAALIYNLDLLASEAFGFTPSLFGRILTGVIISGGANLINDIWPKPQGKVSATATVSSGGETARATIQAPTEDRERG